MTISEAALFVSRWIELSILIKATILLALGLSAAWLAGRGRASVRHVVLTATFFTLLVLPLVAIAGFGVEIQVPAAGSRDATIPAPPSSDAASRAQNLEAGAPPSSQWPMLSWPTIVRGMWIAGAVLFLAPLTVHLIRMRRLRRTGLPWPELSERLPALLAELGVRQSVEVLLHEDIPAPLTCGLWRPAIVLPRDAPEWRESELRCALVHELEHVRRGDWASQLAARAICACYWFHPLVWVAWRRLCLEAERACDDAVVSRAERTDYADQLVSLAQRMSRAAAQPVLGMANRSDLSTRVSALLDSRQRRGRAGFLAAASAIAGALLAVVAIAPVEAVAQSPVTRQVIPRPRPNPLDPALYQAATEGDLSTIDRLLIAGANANGVVPGDGSPLIGAARKGQLPAVRLLLERGADPNLPVPGDGNPLIMAAREGHADVVTLLLDRGARIDEVVPGDENALIQASGRGQLDVVKLLVSRRADVNARVWVFGGFPGQADVEWRTPLSMARRGGHSAVAAFLQSAGARE